MLGEIADAVVLACPLVVTCAAVIVVDRARERRRRELLNRALHELRRPLQALLLQAGREPWRRAARRDQLDQALAALAELDREVNGASPPRRCELVDARVLAVEAVCRWRGSAAVHGRPLELAWHANGSRLVCDPGAVGRALDNLIANALEHGRGPIRVEGSERAGRLRLVIADGVDAGGRAALPPPAPRRAPATIVRHPHQAGDRGGTGARRGHGLRIVADVAADHGGRFAACAHDQGTSAVLELPLAGPAAPARPDLSGRR